MQVYGDQTVGHMTVVLKWQWSFFTNQAIIHQHITCNSLTHLKMKVAA